MPELPEVETIKESLKERILFKKVKEADIMCQKLIKYPESPEFSKNIKDKKIKELQRKGKFLIFKLSHNHNLVVHLGMTGQLLYFSSPQKCDKHTHVTFNFESSDQLQYNDVRKFGGLWLVSDGWLRFVPGLSELGPEPLKKEFSLEYFQKTLTKKCIIKHLLLNQKNLAGLGNIYVDEILFRAEIHPQRPASELSAPEGEKLYFTILGVLEEAIKARGTSVVNYIDGNSQKGEFQRHLKVYKRLGDPCFNCETPVERIVLAGRGTYYCPRCQN